MIVVFKRLKQLWKYACPPPIVLVRDSNQVEPPPLVSLEHSTFGSRICVWLEPGVHKFSQSLKGT
jgi:hypothetical protein